MIVEKTNKAGIDLVVYYFQQKLYANLLGFFLTDATYQCYPRANKNYKGSNVVPEISLDAKEYKNAMYDDNFSLTSFFVTSDEREWQNDNGYLSHDLSIIFQADLIQLYGMSERMDELFLEHVLKVLRSEMKFKTGNIEISEGIDLVYQGFTLSNELKDKIKYDNISNRHVLKLTFNVVYPLGCTSPVVAVCVPGNIIRNGVLVYRLKAGEDYSYETGVCDDATYNLLNSLDQNKGTGTIPSGDTENIDLSDTVVNVYLDEVLVGSANVPYGNDETINVFFT